MKQLRVYLDTSIINFLFADDAPERRDATIEFFRDFVETKIYLTYVSSLVLDEIARTRDVSHRSLLLAATGRTGLISLEMEPYYDQVHELARAYLQAGIIPEKKIDDALHVALATVTEVDVLLSWNYRHLANFNKEALFRAVNLLAGYTKPLRLSTPLDLLHEED